jgi:HAE1 family hydrophobic/amphiphilic exporter-1
MTSLTVIAGNIPAALGLGDGAELRRGLGTAVIGGMITSTILTLVLVPAAYSLLDSLLARIERMRTRRQPARQQPSSMAALAEPPIEPMA